MAGIEEADTFVCELRYLDKTHVWTKLPRLEHHLPCHKV
jgi:hypothetical protein